MSLLLNLSILAKIVCVVFTKFLFLCKGLIDDNAIRNIFWNIFQNSNKVLYYLNHPACDVATFQIRSHIGRDVAHHAGTSS